MSTDDMVPDASQRFFDAPGTVSRYEIDGLTAPEEALIFPLLDGHTRLLDVGVGAGRTTGQLAQLVGTYVGIDYAPNMIAAAAARFSEADLRVADATNLAEFDAASFDVVVFSFNGLDCLSREGRRAALREFHRVLVPGGVLIFSSHDPRSVLRVRPLTEDVTKIKQVMQSTVMTARAMRRAVTSRSFYIGNGFRRDTADPVSLFHASPRYIARELTGAGFAIQQRRPSQPRRGSVIAPAWWYYQAVAI